MTIAPRSPRHIKKTTGYKMPPDIENKMNDLVSSGEFANRADIHTAALRHWFDYRKFNVAEAVRKYLESDEGILLVQRAARKRK